LSLSTVRERSGPVALLAERVGVANAILGVIAGAYLMIALDSTVVNVALPDIGRDLAFSPADLAWVVNSYLLTFGGLLLLGGRIGDVFGRRRAFAAGLAAFTAASVLGGIAPTAAWLVAARALQGVGAALATPNTLALLATNFEQGPARNRALSIYGAVAMIGSSAGLVVGGIVTTYASWRWSLLINLPIGVGIIVLAPRLLEDTARRPGRLDVAGALLSTTAMGSIVFGLIRGGSDGWDGLTWVALGAGLTLLVAFLAVELRAEQPVVPIHLLRSARRMGSYLVLLFLPGAIFGPFFFLTQFLQEFRGFDPLAAGVAFLPQTVAAIVSVRFAPRVFARVGAVRMVVVGALMVGTGLALLTRLSPDASYFGSIPLALIFIGAGAGWLFMPLNVTILADVPSAEAGAASAVAQAMQWVGGSLGLAVLVTVFGAALRSGGQSASTVGSSSAATAFLHGTTSAFMVGILFALAAIVLTTTVIGRGAWRGNPLPRR
jgi:EmrB/QacA subfamily drug resistance transporter